MAQRIIVIQTAFLGDVLLSVPLLSHLKKIYPKSQIDLVCRKGLGGIFTGLELVDRTFEVDKNSGENRTKIFHEIQNESYDLLICPHESPRSTFWVMQINAKEKIGFSKWWNRLVYNKSLKRNLKLPDALRQLSLLTLIDKNLKTLFLNYKGGYVEWATMTVDSLKISGKWQEFYGSVFLAPGSVGPTKQWTFEGYKSVGIHFSTNNKVVIVGSKDEYELCERLKNEIPGAMNLAGKTSLLDMIELFQNGKLLVCNDSGSMHLGSIAGIPTVAIFGPTIPGFGYMPWQKNARVVEKQLPCRPCGKHGHKTCPIRTHECMKKITLYDVLEKSAEVTNNLLR